MVRLNLAGLRIAGCKSPRSRHALVLQLLLARTPPSGAAQSAAPIEASARTADLPCHVIPIHPPIHLPTYLLTQALTCLQDSLIIRQASPRHRIILAIANACARAFVRAGPMP